MSKKEESAIKKVSLRQFIDENYHLFTVLGVFGALTAFFARLENASYLAFIAFAIFLVLDLQLWVMFPRSEEASLSITIFEALFQFFVFAIFVYLAQTYETYVRASFSLIFVVLYVGISIKLFQKFKLYKPIRKIIPQDKFYGSVVRGLTFGIIVGGISVLGIVTGMFVADLFYDFFQ